MEMIHHSQLIEMLNCDARRLLRSLREDIPMLPARSGKSYGEAFKVDPPSNNAGVRPWYGGFVKRLSSMCREMNFAPLDIQWVMYCKGIEGDPELWCQIRFIQI